MVWLGQVTLRLQLQLCYSYGPGYGISILESWNVTDNWLDNW